MVSIVRAGVSCLPIISPAVNLYNMAELNNTIGCVQASMDGTNRATRSFNGASWFSVESRNQGIASLRTQLQGCDAEIQNTGIPGVRKDRIYSICSLVGHVLTIALVVSALALNLLPGVTAGIIIFAFSISGLLIAHRLKMSYAYEAAFIRASGVMTRGLQTLQALPTK